MATLVRAPLATIAVLLFAVGLNGCIWVSQSDFEDKVACLDEDNDLYVARSTCPDLPSGAEADCDDARADRNPGQDELGTDTMWYDGIDQDCDLEDVIDQDGDLYPGIEEADWTAVAPVTWPEELYAEFDCDDLEPTTFPGSPAEAPYDGVDSNCDEKDDWDFDEDGHVPPAACLPMGSATYDGTLPQDDCDDTDPEVYPGTLTADVFYDGIDHDCAGNNDYDQDGDGYIEDAHISAYDAYVQLCGQTDDRTIGDDCDDDPTDNVGKPVTAAQTNPGATETWYDGVDQDCVGDSDYDQDHDTYECDGTVVEACTSHVGDDCDDVTAAVHPTALEKVGDALDQDCDTLIDGAPFQFSTFLWTMPSVPVVNATDRQYLLSVVAEGFEDATATTNPGVLLTFDPSIADGSGLVTGKVWFNGLFGQTQPMGDGDALIAEADRFFVASTLARDNGVNQLRLHRGDWSDSQNSYLLNESSSPQGASLQRNPAGPLPHDLDHLDFDVMMDSSNQYWAAACGTHAIQFVVATDAGGTSPLNDVEGTSVFLEDAGFIACYLEEDTATQAILHTYDGSGTHVEYDLKVGTPALHDGSIEVCVPNGRTCTDDSNGYGVVDVNQRDGMLVFTGTSGVTVWSDSDQSSTWGPFLGTENVVSADAWLADGTLYIAAVIDEDTSDVPDGTRDVVLLYGNPTSPPATLDPDTPEEVEDRILFYEHPDLDPEPEPDGVSIYVDDALVADPVVFIAVSGLETGGATGDTVGWVFMGLD
jgi:hypothetical protein